MAGTGCGSHRGWLPDLAAVEVRGGRVRLVVADPAENALLDDAARAASPGGRRGVGPHPPSPLPAEPPAACPPRCPTRARGHGTATPRATALVVDADAGAPRLVDGARCADGDLWVRGRCGWAALTATGMLTAEDRARVGLGPERWAGQEAAMRNHHTVGLVTDPTVETFDGRDESEVVVTTGGSRLEPQLADADRVAQLGWRLAEGIGDVGDDWPHPHPFGGIGVVRERWVG